MMENPPKIPKMENSTIGSVPKGVYLSDHLMWDILVHLPAKSLMRFKCVSKLFNSIIRNLDFAKEHSLRGGCFKGLLITDFVAREPQLYPSGGLNRVFYADYNAGNCESCRSVMYYYHFSWDLKSFSGVTAIVKGLIGLHKHECFTLCNVSTREMVELPRNEKAEYYNYHLGFDPVREVYKVLKVYLQDENSTTFNTQIFTVGGGSDLTWRGIDLAPADCDTQSVCIGGTLYWVPSYDSDFGSALIAFNLSSESFDTITLPGISISGANLAEIGGSPALVFFSSGDVNIWMMNNGEREGLGAWAMRTYRLPVEDLILAGTLPTGEMLISRSCVEEYPLWDSRRGVYHYALIFFRYVHSINEMRLVTLAGYRPSRSQEDGMEYGSEMQMWYHEENIIPLAPLLNMQRLIAQDCIDEEN